MLVMEHPPAAQTVEEATRVYRDAAGNERRLAYRVSLTGKHVVEYAGHDDVPSVWPCECVESARLRWDGLHRVTRQAGFTRVGKDTINGGVS